MYKNAFKCSKCPQSNGQDGCPAWVEIMQTNTATGEERLHKDCLFQQLPHLMVEVVKASNRPAAAVEEARNEIANGFNQLNQVMPLLTRDED